MPRALVIRAAFFLALTATLYCGCSVLDPKSAPKAEFDASVRTGTAPLQVQFTDRSEAGSSPISQRTWFFGDGEESAEANPLHTYAQPGTYSVTLHVATKDGTDFEEKAAFITVSAPVGPSAEFLGQPRSGQKPLSVQFTDQSNAGTGTITSWSWSFGDGATSTSQNPTHVYQNDGIYDVSLTIQTSLGTSTKSKPDYIIVSSAPVAAFSGTPRSGFKPLSVQFTDQSAPGTSPITAWAWSFGDGGTSTTQNPSHTYNTAGTYTVSLTITTADGSDIEEKPGYVVVSDPAPPVAGFSGAPRTGSIPLSVQFTDQSTPGSFPITAWSWSFGDGGTSTAQNPSHTYSAFGSYDVSLTVTTSAGSDIDSKAGYIVATKPPTAAFDGSPRTGSSPLTVQFTDQSTAGSSPITGWSWTFGDGGTSTAQNPSHTYTSAGTYTVALTVTASDGSDSESKAAFVAVNVPPVGPTASFSGSPTSGAIPLSVQFNDLSTSGTSNITSWQWSFGDGGTSTAQNPSHTYSAFGTYDVSLTVTTNVGTDGETKVNYIVATKPPTAAFDGSPRSGDYPLAVQFTNQSTAGSSPITGWSWTFGDGGTSTAQNPSHTYSSAGTYTVSLTATAADGSDSVTKPAFITVTEPPVAPTAEFSGSPTHGDIPLSVQFSDLSTPGTAPITSWQWTFGDGGTSTAQNPSHTYSSFGSYDVSLTVTTADGSDGELKTSYIVATQPPTAAFDGSPRSGDYPLTVDFTDQSTQGSSPITGWSWTFGDGGTSTAQNPSHTYLAAGTYTVALTVTTDDGTDSATKPAFITVSQPPAPPTADFSGTPTSGPAPLDVQFSDLSTPGTAPITSWLWSFGDGGTSTSQNPSHTYLLPGTYTVSLLVTTADGSDTATKSEYISACLPPTAEFLTLTTSGLAPLTVQFTDLSTPGTEPISTWSWSFGDGGTSTSQNPTHIYTAPGTYDVTLTVSGSCGSDTQTKTGYITVQDACTNVNYSVADATFEIRMDGDQDGCAERARVHYDVDVDRECSKSVFARVSLRPKGTTEWSININSACFTVAGTTTADEVFTQLQGIPADTYEIRIQIFECGGTEPVASRDYLDDPDLDNRCME